MLFESCLYTCDPFCSYFAIDWLFCHTGSEECGLCVIYWIYRDVFRDLVWFNLLHQCRSPSLPGRMMNRFAPWNWCSRTLGTFNSMSRFNPETLYAGASVSTLSANARYAVCHTSPTVWPKWGAATSGTCTVSLRENSKWNSTQHDMTFYKLVSGSRVCFINTIIMYQL